jgi:hypothetical protein
MVDRPRLDPETLRWVARRMDERGEMLAAPKCDCAIHQALRNTVAEIAAYLRTEAIKAGGDGDG